MLKPLSPSSSLSRNISFNVFKRRPSCCDKEEHVEPTPKYIIQKSCQKSIFEIWKPKVPDLNACNYPTIQSSMMMPYKHKTCSAGMKFRDKTRCEIETMARECQKMNHPKWLRNCPRVSNERLFGPLPPLKAAEVKCKDAKGKEKGVVIRSLRHKCDPRLPEGDWNPDGHLS